MYAKHFNIQVPYNTLMYRTVPYRIARFFALDTIVRIMPRITQSQKTREVSNIVPYGAVRYNNEVLYSTVPYCTV